MNVRYLIGVGGILAMPLLLVGSAPQKKRIPITQQEVNAARTTFTRDIPPDITRRFLPDFEEKLAAYKQASVLRAKELVRQKIASQRSDVDQALRKAVTASLTTLHPGVKKEIEDTVRGIYRLRDRALTLSFTDWKKELALLGNAKGLLKQQLAKNEPLRDIVTLMMDDAITYAQRKIAPWSQEVVNNKINETRNLIARWKNVNRGDYQSLQDSAIEDLMRSIEDAHAIALQVAGAYERYSAKQGTWDAYKQLETLFIDRARLIKQQFAVVELQAKNTYGIPFEDRKGISKILTDVATAKLAGAFAQGRLTSWALSKMLVKQVRQSRENDLFMKLVDYYMKQLIEDNDAIQNRYSRFSFTRLTGKLPENVFADSTSFFVSLIKEVVKQLR